VVLLYWESPPTFTPLCCDLLVGRLVPFHEAVGTVFRPAYPSAGFFFCTLAKNWDLSYYSLRHCMGSDKQLKPSSFGSQLRRTSENVPIHGEPNLEGFSFPVTVPSTIVAGLHGLPEREHWSRLHLPTNHAAC
jgi:hypothetical protein